MNHNRQNLATEPRQRLFCLGDFGFYGNSLRAFDSPGHTKISWAAAANENKVLSSDDDSWRKRTKFSDRTMRSFKKKPDMKSSWDLSQITTTSRERRSQASRERRNSIMKSWDYLRPFVLREKKKVEPNPRRTQEPNDLRPLRSRSLDCNYPMKKHKMHSTSEPRNNRSSEPASSKLLDNFLKPHFISCMLNANIYIAKVIRWAKKMKKKNGHEKEDQRKKLSSAKSSRRATFNFNCSRALILLAFVFIERDCGRIHLAADYRSRLISRLRN